MSTHTERGDLYFVNKAHFIRILSVVAIFLFSKLIVSFLDFWAANAHHRLTFIISHTHPLHKTLVCSSYARW